jgi:hypothetical protein
MNARLTYVINPEPKKKQKTRKKKNRKKNNNTEDSQKALILKSIKSFEFLKLIKLLDTNVIDKEHQTSPATIHQESCYALSFEWEPA